MTLPKQPLEALRSDSFYRADTPSATDVRDSPSSLTLVAFDTCELRTYLGDVPLSESGHRSGKLYILCLLEWHLGLE